MIPVPRPIPGIAFFPGGYGLWREDTSAPLPPWPKGGVMILGHDFHSESGYRASLARGREAKGQPTWRTLCSVLDLARVDLRECFFTNAYMGLRKGNGTTGKFPGATDPVFVDACRRFLLVQIAAQAPRTILTLGGWVSAMIAPLSPSLESWRDAKSFAEIDAAGALKRDVRFAGLSVSPSVAALTHPSQRRLNVGRRVYAGRTGEDAELALLAAALSY